MITQAINTLLGRNQREAIHSINNRATKDWLLVQVRARKLAEDAEDLHLQINSVVERFAKMRKGKMRKKR